VLATRALLEWPQAVALTTNFGTAAFALLSAGDRSYASSSLVEALLPAWRVAALVAIAASPLVVLDITAKMAGVSWSEALPLVPQVIAQTHAGRVWQWYFPALILMSVCTVAPLRPIFRATAIAGAAGLTLYLQAMLGHATDHGLIAESIYFVHEAGAGLWLGALFALWLITRRGQPPAAWIERAASRVSKIALWSVVAIVLSGSYVAYLGLGADLDHLLYSSYGRTLMVKLAIFAAVLPIGAYNRFWLIPDLNGASRRTLLRNVGLESLIIALGVLGVAALLANTPPTHPHMTMPGMNMSM
jgi:putative copper resistance protein D